MGRPPKARKPAILRHPAVIESDVAPPPHLRPEAHQYWHEAIGHLTSMGLLTQTDFGTIERYAILRSQVAECHKLEQVHGQYKIVMTTDADGNEVIKKADILPWTVQTRMISPMLLRIESEWGFTPATRGYVTQKDYASLDELNETTLEGFLASGSQSKRA